MNALKLVPATEANLEQIMELEHECFDRDAWLEETMRFELLADHTRYFVLLEGDSVLGYAGLSKLPGNDQADVRSCRCGLFRLSYGATA